MAKDADGKRRPGARSAADELAELDSPRGGTAAWYLRVSTGVLAELKEIRRRWQLPPDAEDSLSYHSRRFVFRYCKKKWGAQFKVGLTAFSQWLMEEPEEDE